MQEEVTVNQIIDIYDFVIGYYGETLTVNNYNYLENCYHEVKVIAKGIFLSFPISIFIWMKSDQGQWLILISIPLMKWSCSPMYI